MTTATTMTGSKRKASDVNGGQNDERPALVKRRTFTYGILPTVEDSLGLQQCPEVLMSTQTNIMMNAPAVEGFQSRLTNFCERYGPSFGSTYVAKLQVSHSEVVSSNDFSAVIEAGQTFMETMEQYIQDLQQAAVQQIQTRASVMKIGIRKETVAAMDVVLSQLDRTILEIGAEMSELWQELSILEGQREIHFGETLPQQTAYPSGIVAF